MSAPEAWSDLGVSELPTGTVTLLLADVEGSTRLWETQPEQMTAALARLNTAVTGLVASHGGVRPVEQGEGDSFVVASTVPATRWRVRWSCSGRRWRRSARASASTPARYSCATKATTRVQPSTGLRACVIWGTAVKRCCPVRRPSGGRQALRRGRGPAATHGRDKGREKRRKEDEKIGVTERAVVAGCLQTRADRSGTTNCEIVPGRAVERSVPPDLRNEFGRCGSRSVRRRILPVAAHQFHLVAARRSPTVRKLLGRQPVGD